MKHLASAPLGRAGLQQRRPHPSLRRRSGAARAFGDATTPGPDAASNRTDSGAAANDAGATDGPSPTGNDAAAGSIPVGLDPGSDDASYVESTMTIALALAVTAPPDAGFDDAVRSSASRAGSRAPTRMTQATSPRARRRCRRSDDASQEGSVRAGPPCLPSGSGDIVGEMGDWFRASAIAALVALAPAAARANGRFPAANMLVARPGDPSHLVVRATYGLLFSSDGGATWDWLCERAAGYGGNEDPTITLTGSGAVLAGAFRSFARSTDDGCTWQHGPRGPESIVDMALRPSAPDRVYAVSCLFSRVGDAGAQLFHSELLVSDDAGEHWATRIELDPSLLIDSVEVAPNDPARVYVSAIRPRGKETGGVILASSDDGKRFVERSVPFTPSDRGVYVAAVDPRRADRIYLRTSGVDASKLALSDDAGKTSRTVLEGGPLLGFALADEGETIYAGGPKDGLVVASAKDIRFAQRSPLPIECLTVIGPTLWACAPTRSGFVLGASADGGRTFEPRLTLAGMRGPLRCAGSTTLAECGADWASFRQLVGTDGAGDAGPPKASSAPARPRACGCGIGGGGTRFEDDAIWPLGLVLAWSLRRVRARRSGVPR